MCDMEYFHRNIPEIRNVFIFRNILNDFQKREKTHMEFEKSINLLEINKG